MKAFLDKRIKELDDEIGGTWRMIETKHFYCFANIKEDIHKRIAVDWNEKTFYDLVSGVLKHKEGDKLWNNKCPIYYFEKFSQFQKFAAVIDHQPKPPAIPERLFFGGRPRCPCLYSVRYPAGRQLTGRRTSRQRHGRP